MTLKSVFWPVEAWTRLRCAAASRGSCKFPPGFWSLCPPEFSGHSAFGAISRSEWLGTICRILALQTSPPRLAAEHSHGVACRCDSLRFLPRTPGTQRVRVREHEASDRLASRLTVGGTRLFTSHRSALRKDQPSIVLSSQSSAGERRASKTLNVRFPAWRGFVDLQGRFGYSVDSCVCVTRCVEFSNVVFPCFNRLGLPCPCEQRVRSYSK